MHDDAPEVLYFPALQEVHDDAPALPANWPAGHDVQPPAHDAEYLCKQHKRAHEQHEPGVSQGGFGGSSAHEGNIMIETYWPVLQFAQPGDDTPPAHCPALQQQQLASRNPHDCFPVPHSNASEASQPVPHQTRQRHHRRHRVKRQDPGVVAPPQWCAVPCKQGTEVVSVTVQETVRKSHR